MAVAALDIRHRTPRPHHHHHYNNNEEMSNFESVLRRNICTHQQKIKELEQEVLKYHKQQHPLSPTSAAIAATRQHHLKEAQQALVEYMLDAAPYVKQYFAPAAAAGPNNATTCCLPSTTIMAPPVSSKANGQCTWLLEQSRVQRKGSVFRQYMAKVECRPAAEQPGGSSSSSSSSNNNISNSTASISSSSSSSNSCSAGGSSGKRQYYETCTDCEGSPCLVADRDFSVCPQCGRCYPSANLSYENLSFEQQISDIVPVACYRRSNHFSEWLSKLQAREATKIPEDVLTAVKLELKKQRLTEPAQITQAKIKEILKKLRLSKFYEHVPSIHTIITKTSAPKFPAALEEKLKQLFDEIQEPFERFKGSKRSNMLSYGFLLYKFCELLGEDEYLPYLPLLKSTSKLWDCDQVWKKICADRQWEFVPTV